MSTLYDTTKLNKEDNQLFRMPVSQGKYTYIYIYNWLSAYNRTFQATPKPPSPGTELPKDKAIALAKKSASRDLGLEGSISEKGGGVDA